MNNSQTTGMRGLTHYISELRATGARDAEEKCVNKEMAHIRLKFRSTPKLDGYQRKKYVAKIIFTYLQGYKVDVGFPEALALMASHKYSEKQIVGVVADPRAILRSRSTCTSTRTFQNRPFP